MQDELKTVASFSTAVEAHLLAATLEAAGIEAVICDEHTVTMNWLYSNLIGGVRVKVRETDLEDAQRILKTESTPPSSAEDIPSTLPMCPACGSDDIEFSTDKRGAFVSWLLLGFPIIAPKKELKCKKCGHSWPYK
ncbi:hypothetical protein MNBD_DELTA02-212 [hydrothermal vent metagenome]|uniref:DUF2007 domain-containing protein n=1 Tax=hydrothermal vent metagenome TaxID=652676 RepID=A0A3B0W5T8_9ZZZZ